VKVTKEVGGLLVSSARLEYDDRSPTSASANHPLGQQSTACQTLSAPGAGHAIASTVVLRITWPKLPEAAR
jgi:hypothetical protein